MTACAKRASAMLVALLLLGTAANADTLIMTLDNVQTGDCDTPWTEGVCDLQVVDTAIGDYTPPGNCIWFPQAEGLALFGARLEIDTTALTGLETVEVDLREVSGDGRTRIFLFEEGATNYFQFVMSTYDGGATDQTLPLFTAGFEVGKIAISGHEALITEVRLIGNLIVGNEAETWSVLKTRW